MKKQKTQSKIIVALTAVVILLVAVSATLTFAYFTANSNSTSNQMTFGTLGLTVDPALATSTTCTHAKTESNINKLVPGCNLTIGAANNITVTGNIAAFVRVKVTITAWQTHYVDANGNAVAYASTDVYDETNNPTGVQGVKAYKANGDEAGQGDTVAFHAIKTTATKVDSNSGEFASVVFTTMGDVGANWIVYTPNSGDENGVTSFYYNASVTNSSITFTDTFTLSASALGNAWQGAYMKVGIVVEAVQAEHLTTMTNTAVSDANVATLAAEVAWTTVNAGGVVTP